MKAQTVEEYLANGGEIYYAERGETGYKEEIKKSVKDDPKYKEALEFVKMLNGEWFIKTDMKNHLNLNNMNNVTKILNSMLKDGIVEIDEGPFPKKKFRMK